MSRKKRRVDAKGRNPGGVEHWTKMIRSTMETPAWRALSPAAQALYPWLKLEWRGVDNNNNGQLRLSVRQAAERVGIANNRAAKCFVELQAKGFLVQTEGASLGTSGAARSPSYELTELALPTGGTQGRMLYRDWRPGGDFPVRRTPPNNPAGHNGKTKPCLQNEDDTVFILKTKRERPSSK